MDKELYQNLVNQFAMYEESEVLEILNNPDSSDEAIAACKYVLSGKSKEVEQYNQKISKNNELLQKKQDNIISDPSYEYTKQMAGDIRFMRNIVIIGIIFEFISIIVSFVR
ncbi:hypothetical protein [Roseburia sp. MSJ-14]|uniref:hypothetical protein n=1 Tax=Roseburia sp. MSJ-14 TaxID=2841514 RepID=UPI001C10CEEA|nr:hypothetical protein [Roseburia sp. MSJ-14]MBU5473950.1 hypothetical protein [Roseburia sp. MSJ-14]